MNSMIIECNNKRKFELEVMSIKKVHARMKISFLILCFCQLSFPFFGQLTGNWQGLVIREGKSIDQATILYLEVKTTGDFVARSREEVIGKEGFIVKKIKGTVTDKELKLQQFAIEKRKEIYGIKWCNMNFNLRMNDTTGYLEGKFTSPDCRGNLGKIVCYRVTNTFNTEPTVKELQSWRPIFSEDLKKGRKSQEKRTLERKNFDFHPVLFDYDQAVVKEEYHEYLKSMAQVVLGHTDLRIRVIGHTDSDGVAIYNEDLSRRRAEAILQLFLQFGLSKDKVELDFKGESIPIDNNTTEEGKQRNRRVDFEFI